VDLTFTPEQLAFRDELRAWLAEHGPAGALTPEPDDEDESWEWRREWQRTLARGGWAGVHWPTEVGGRGATLTETAIFFEELGRSGAPLPADVLGILLAGPTLMVWGDDAQKERLLPTILSADETWCQGFSEPDAGSDFAAVKTRAVPEDPDDPESDFLVTGQKVWTSGAQYAKWCMLVARTGDPVAAPAADGAAAAAAGAASAGSPVRATSMHHLAYCAPEVQTFWPVTSQSESGSSGSSSTARVLTAAKSEPASGSEKPWHHVSSAERIVGSSRSCCASSPQTISVGPASRMPRTSAGSGAPERPSSSKKIAVSVSVAPRPPTSVGQCTPAQPPFASVRCHSRRHSQEGSSPSGSGSSDPAGPCSASHARSSSRKASCSGVKVRSTAAPR
jgi:hypothetical protein